MTAIAVSALMAMATVSIALGLALHFRLALPLDVANHRSLHVGAVPRIGGAAMALAIVLPMSLPGLLVPVPGGLILPAALLALLSLVDDFRPLAVWFRLGGHVVAALVAVLVLDLAWPWALLLIPVLVWMTNLFNFMDGADGLAGSMTVVGFSAYALAAWPNDIALTGLAATIAASAAGFLVYNVSPAKVFMGDAGSIPLGFLAGALGAYGWNQGLWPAWFPCLVFLPFITDATVTLGRRLLAGERVWEAHRDHAYQHLVLLGWGHRRLLLVEAGGMVACAASGFALLSAPSSVQWVGVAVWFAGGVAAWLRVERLWRRRANGLEN